MRVKSLGFSIHSAQLYSCALSSFCASSLFTLLDVAVVVVTERATTGPLIFELWHLSPLRRQTDTMDGDGDSAHEVKDFSQVNRHITNMIHIILYEPVLFIRHFRTYSHLKMGIGKI